jgi:hypothetical protein
MQTNHLLLAMLIQCLMVTATDAQAVHADIMFRSEIYTSELNGVHNFQTGNASRYVRPHSADGCMFSDFVMCNFSLSMAASLAK